MPLDRTPAQRQEEERREARRKREQAEHEQELREAREDRDTLATARVQHDALVICWPPYMHSFCCWLFDYLFVYNKASGYWMGLFLVALLLWRLIGIVLIEELYPRSGTLFSYATTLSMAVFIFSRSRALHEGLAAALSLMWNMGCAHFIAHRKC